MHPMSHQYECYCLRERRLWDGEFCSRVRRRRRRILNRHAYETVATSVFGLATARAIASFGEGRVVMAAIDIAEVSSRVRTDGRSCLGPG